ncbi:hypothetical protein EDB87DRAFT_1785862 [Lactarius vividus]|nr:hypothetical protein EDB87DRAFT_1785862 [Lactarius vividus]
MSWSALPTELSLRILTFFGPAELVLFRTLNSFFKSLIDETTTLQYRIALFASGMEDGPPGGLTTSERLELLKNYEASWKNLQWNEHTTLPLPAGSLWELYGNVWAHSRGSDAIEFVQIPSRLRGIPMRQWTLRFDYDLRDFGMDPSQDLLVTIENFRNSPTLCRIQSRALSTGERHPLAGNTAIVEHTLTVPEEEVILDRWSYSIRVGGDYVGILFAESSGDRNELVVWSWRTGVRRLVVLSANIRSFVFLGDNFILGSTLEPPALLVYTLERRPADGTTYAKTHLLRFLFGRRFRATRELLLTSDPSPGWLPSAGLQVPFQIAGDERIIAMNLQLYYIWEGLFECKTVLIPTKTLLGQIENCLIKDRYDVDWESCGPQIMEHLPEHGIWDVWTCFVFGMRYIQPRVDHLRGNLMMIVRDIHPRRCLRASEEEREQSNALYQSARMTWSPDESYPRSILKCAPLPESIQDPRNVKLMISEDGIVVREVRHRKTCVFIAARLMRLDCRETLSRAKYSFICSRSDELSLDGNRLTGFVRVIVFAQIHFTENCLLLWLL